MTSSLRAGLLLLGISYAFTASLTAAQDTTLHVDVKLVNVFANVTDRNGAFVGGLTKSDFAVTEDGRPQQIAVFETQSELPLNLTLAIDTSGSVQKDLSEERAAARRFAHALVRQQDQMSVMQFAYAVDELTPFTNKLSQINRALNQLRGGGATAFYDAIEQASVRLGTMEGRKVLVVISDGENTVRNTTYARALEQALRDEVMIYSLIDVPIEASAGRSLGGEHALITLSEETGGKYFYVNDGGLDKAFSKVSDDLRTQYLIGYYSHNQDPGRVFHRIRVTVPRSSTQDFIVRHKTGYYSDSEPRLVEFNDAQNSPPPNARLVSFPSSGGTLYGFLSVPEGSGPFPAVLWNHSSDKRPGWQPQLASFYNSHGFVFFLPHRRGQGRSPGPYIMDEIHVRGIAAVQDANEDVVAAMNWLKAQPEVDASRIVVSGWAFGGTQTLLTAEKGLGARAFIAFAPAVLSWGNGVTDDMLERAVERAKAPVFILQAENDYNTQPTEVLGKIATTHGGKARIYPSFGNGPQEGLAAFATTSGGIAVWGDDVLQFIEAAFR